MFEKLQTDYQRFQEVEAALLDPETTSDPSRIASLAKERGTLAKLSVPYGRYLDTLSDIEELSALRDAEVDHDTRSYYDEEIAQLRLKENSLGETLRDFLYDKVTGGNHASLIVEIRAGTGGDEAALFARDLYEMYRRYSETKRWKFEPIDLVPTELGGFREVTFSIAGDGAFRHLQFESGGHRVQRVPETETQGRIHTSAATVAIMPEPEDVAIVIRAEDIETDVMRAGGPGGQHQNKTESAVRLTHVPSGIVVVCRDERSQHKNRVKAMRVLKSRLFEQTVQKAADERAEQRRTLIGSGDRSQRIRTYNFPQNRMTDHRIGLTLYNLDRVILGDLDPLMTALIEHDRREQLGEA